MQSLRRLNRSVERCRFAGGVYTIDPDQLEAPVMVLGWDVAANDCGDRMLGAGDVMLMITFQIALQTALMLAVMVVAATGLAQLVFRQSVARQPQQHGAVLHYNTKYDCKYSTLCHSANTRWRTSWRDFSRPVLSLGSYAVGALRE
jgi:hypothetical protein